MKYVIIGASAAGISAAKTLRKQCPSDQITVIATDELIHSRMMMHLYLSRRKTKQQICFVPADFMKANQIEHLSGKLVTAIRPEKNIVLLSDGAEISYDRLLLAAGARYFIPPIPHLREAKNVFGFRDLSDAEKLDRLAEEGKHCVIIGSGLVGLDVASALCERGLRCSVVELADRISPLQLDHTASRAYQTLFEQAGCTFYLSNGVTDSEITDDLRVSGVLLKSGERLACDFVVVSAGVRPNIAFLEGSGIQTDRGVLVDDFLRTNMQNIWAAGDITGLSGIWPAATTQGEIAAQNMCGIKTSYDDRFALKNTMSYFGLNTLTLGSDDGETAGEEILRRELPGQYEKYKLVHNLLTYALVQGDISNRGFLQQLVKRRLVIKNRTKPIYELSAEDFPDDANPKNN